jgi:hypothetical protein
MGQKIDDIAEKYFNNKDKKTLIGEFLKVVEIENSTYWKPRIVGYGTFIEPKK